ncbi:hypothetical protein BN946_scf185007.g289 [Trametes cinnabarina]|uniref:Pre-rRNA-processing protein n=1 Tax=Pycnoporus cinnabarinus TaxID=5643 RepID=A0A060SLY2_PYCCI|nr:hypothetical protein BN946_scf185007.g289 [Trametes cinnabarina]
MPKSSKKKKDKAADFSKAKLKLGKGKQAPNNTVDTSFKARSIALPSQSIAVDKNVDAPTTKRRLTFDALMMHLKHYNAMIRRGDAHAVRFLDIFLEHIPEIVVEGWTQHASSSHGRRVLEGYLGILNAGTSFGEGGDTGPVQATSTASVVLSSASKLVVLRSLANFLSHAVAFASYSTDAALDSPSAALTTPTWYFSSSFASSSAFEAFDSLLRPRWSSTDPSMTHQRDATRTWVPEYSDESQEDFAGRFDLTLPSSLAPWTVQELNSTVTDVSMLNEDKLSGLSGPSPDVAAAAHVARTLQPTLVSTFLDCAPAVFSPSTTPAETETQMVLVVCRLCRSLYGRVLQDAAESGRWHETAEADLQTMLSYLSPYFPFVSTSQVNMKRDIKVEQCFQDLNLIYCELSSFLVLASQVIDRRPSMVRKPRARSARVHPALSSESTSPISARQIERVSRYIVQLLRGEPPSSGIQPSLPRPITPQAYVSLLPTIWSFINSSNADVADASTTLFSAFIEHALKASSSSAVKRHTIDFIGRLVLLDREPEYQGSFRSGGFPDQDAKLQEWIMHLPKTLWELGGSHLPTTETIVRVLLRLSQRRSRLLQQTTYASLRLRLVPYFSISHPTRGKVAGPYAKLPAESPIRRLVLDLVATITGNAPDKADPSNGELVAAVAGSVQGTAEELYFSDIVAPVR